MRFIFLLPLILILMPGCASRQKEVAKSGTSCRLSAWGRLGFHSAKFDRCVRLEDQYKKQAQIDAQDKAEQDRCDADPKCDIEGKKKKAKEKAELAMQIQLEIIRNKLKKQVGLSIDDYRKFLGEPDNEEVVNKNIVLWYNGKEPYFVTFENGKLISWQVDRETIYRRADREERFMREMREAETRRQEAWALTTQRMFGTSCTSQRFGNTVYTNCN